MSVRRRSFVASYLVLATLVLGACVAQKSPPTATPDIEATVQARVAQTREAEQATVPSATADVEPTPTATQQSAADTSTPTPTATQQPAADAPTPTREKLLIAESLVDGDDGNDRVRGSSTSNQGRVVLLPGFAQEDVADPVVFRDRIVFQIEVFDTRVGSSDGSGIRDVTFRIEPDDGSGQVVYERKDEYPGYCVFGGGEPDCDVLPLVEDGSHWPGGDQIFNGLYLSRIDIVAANGEKTQWRWRFIIDVPGRPLYNTARINSIAVKDGRYVVDFETFGSEPQVPGQHVHFFFDTVPPKEAGRPGNGPWQIYPAGAGQPNSSPFTLLAVAQRPAGAKRMCILVANPDHSVNQNTGNCVDLP